jgi:hypothetical protein
VVGAQSVRDSLVYFVRATVTDVRDAALADYLAVLFAKLIVRMVQGGMLTADGVLAEADATRDLLGSIGDPGVPPIIARPIDDAELETYREAVESARERSLRTFELLMGGG